MATRPILTLAICFPASMAVASPRSDPTVGRGVFTGATVPHASSITLNPAALGIGLVDEIYVATTGVVESYDIRRKQLDLATGTLGDGPRVADSELGVGGMLAVVLHPGTRYAVSFEVRSPPPELFPRDHDELRYHTLGVRQRDYLASIGSTIKITSRLYFGASVSHDNTVLRLRYARDTALADGEGPRGLGSDCGGMPCGLEDPAASETYDVDVSSKSFAASNLKVNLGLLARIYRDVWLGIAYHTPPGFDIQSKLDGDMRVTRAPRDGGGVLRGGSTVYAQYPASVDAELRARLPQLLDLTIGGRWEDLSRFAAYDVRGHGSTFVPNGVPEWTLRPRGMHDPFAVWGGIEQIDVGQPFRFGGRIGFETAAVDDERTSPMTIAPASLTLDGGVQARLGRSWMVELTYGLQYFSGVEVDRSAYDPRYQLDCIASGFDYATRACQAVREGYAIPTAAGDYGRIQHAARLGLRYELP
ncbi:MAG: hypothetical protein H0X17_17040 [Deltaproteobacteria bacterium]|nr:hypothetical protein [Deltaproteobacteria bacterium]